MPLHDIAASNILRSNFNAQIVQRIFCKNFINIIYELLSFEFLSFYFYYFRLNLNKTFHKFVIPLFTREISDLIPFFYFMCCFNKILIKIYIQTEKKMFLIHVYYLNVFLFKFN